MVIYSPKNAINRIIEWENLILIDVEETSWTAEVKHLFLTKTPGYPRRSTTLMHKALLIFLYSSHNSSSFLNLGA